MTTDFHIQLSPRDRGRVVLQSSASVFSFGHFITGQFLKTYNSMNLRWLKIFDLHLGIGISERILNRIPALIGITLMWSFWSFSWVAKWYFPLNLCWLFSVTVHFLSNASCNFIAASGCQLEQQYCPAGWSSVSADEAVSWALITVFKILFCTHGNAWKDIMRSNSNF